VFWWGVVGAVLFEFLRRTIAVALAQPLTIKMALGTDDLRAEHNVVYQRIFGGPLGGISVTHNQISRPFCSNVGKRSGSRVVPGRAPRTYSAISWDWSITSSTVSQRLSAISC
jgi:hypothetical protein